VAKIGMFGAGYVGLVTGACFADLGHEVVIRDVVPERIERLQAGEPPGEMLKQQEARAVSPLEIIQNEQ
jgi:UDPglucose 6-dehydrogenase